MKARRNGGLKTLLRFRLVPMVILAMLVLLPAASASFSENFDSYPNTTVSPRTPGNPWTQTATNSTCFSGSQVFSYGLAAGAFSPPNVYQFFGSADPACFTASENVKLTANLNMTGPTISFLFHIQSLGMSNNSYHFTVGVCGQTFTLVTLGHTTNYWQNFTGSVAATSSCPFFFELSSVMGGTTDSINAQVDSLILTGANVEISPFNIQLLDTHTRLPFPISSYPGSKIIMNYTQTTSCASPLVQLSSKSCADINLYTSYSEMPLSHVSLMTVEVGNSYYRTLIPYNLTLTTVYLDDPTTVTSYQITVTDLSSTFVSGSTVTISQGGSIITSGYLDSTSGFALALNPGAYTFHLQSGAFSYVTTINFGSVQAIPVQITKFTTSSNLGGIANTDYSANWGCDTASIVGFYTDSSSSTTKVVYDLYNQSNSGTYLVSTVTDTGTIGASEVTFTGVNSSQGTYLILFIVTDSTGIHNVGPRYATPGNPSCPDAFPSIIPNLPNFPIVVFGLDQILPNANGWSEVLGFTLLVLTAGIFGARYGTIGFIVLAFEAMWLFLALFIPSNYTLLYLFIAMAVIGFMIMRKRRLS